MSFADLHNSFWRKIRKSRGIFPNYHFFLNGDRKVYRRLNMILLLLLQNDALKV